MTTLDSYPPELAVGVTSSRIGDVSPAARQLHRAILRGFATTGHAPTPAELGAGASRLLNELHEHDVVRLDERGNIRAAYPFSATPTAHLVTIDDGPTVYAMCAIDALGIGAMLHRDTTISTTDPSSGETIEVTIRDRQATWAPPTAVAFVGSDTTVSGKDCCTPDGHVAAADRCCGVLNLFTNTDHARQWMAAQPQVTGMVLTKEQALRLGIDIFGPLLHD